MYEPPTRRYFRRIGTRGLVLAKRRMGSSGIGRRGSDPVHDRWPRCFCQGLPRDWSRDTAPGRSSEWSGLDPPAGSGLAEAGAGVRWGGSLGSGRRRKFSSIAVHHRDGSIHRTGLVRSAQTGKDGLRIGSGTTPMIESSGGVLESWAVARVGDRRQSGPAERAARARKNRSMDDSWIKLGMSRTDGTSPGRLATRAEIQVNS